jgi:molybdopterin-guanine dinucleotide biosynthesis protein A
MIFDGVVLAGGSAHRLGGIDKALIEVGGRSLLERALVTLHGARLVVVVGPRRATSVPVEWTRESPTGGGPLEAVAAGLRPATAPFVVLLGVDHPFVGAPVVGSLLNAIGDRDGAVLTDGEGEAQYLVGAYRTTVVREAVNRRRPGGGGSLRSVFDALDVGLLRDERAAFDIDSLEDVDRAQEMSKES